MLEFCFLDGGAGSSWGLGAALIRGAVFAVYNQTNALTGLTPIDGLMDDKDSLMFCVLPEHQTQPPPLFSSSFSSSF